MNRDAFYVPRWQENKNPIEGVVESGRSVSAQAQPQSAAANNSSSSSAKQPAVSSSSSSGATASNRGPAVERGSVSTAPFGGLRTVPGQYRGGSDSVLAPFGVIDPPPFSTPSSVSFSPDETVRNDQRPLHESNTRRPAAATADQRTSFRSPTRRELPPAAGNSRKEDQPRSEQQQYQPPTRQQMDRARNNGNFLLGRPEAVDPIAAAVAANSRENAFVRGSMDLGVDLGEPRPSASRLRSTAGSGHNSRNQTPRHDTSRLKLFRERQNQQLQGQQQQQQQQPHSSSSSAFGSGGTLNRSSYATDRFGSQHHSRRDEYGEHANNNNNNNDDDDDDDDDPVDQQDELDLLLYACSAQETEQKKLKSIREQQAAAKRGSRGALAALGGLGDTPESSGDFYDNSNNGFHGDGGKNKNTAANSPDADAGPLTEHDAMLFQRLMQRKVLWVRRAQHSLYDWASRLQAYEQALAEREARLADAETQRAAAYQERLVALTEAETAFRRAINEQKKQQQQQREQQELSVGRGADDRLAAGAKGDYSLSDRIRVANNYLNNVPSTAAGLSGGSQSRASMFPSSSGYSRGRDLSSSSRGSAGGGGGGGGANDDVTVIAVDMSPAKPSASSSAAAKAKSGGGTAGSAPSSSSATAGAAAASGSGSGGGGKNKLGVDGKPVKSALRAPSFALDSASGGSGAGQQKKAAFVNI